ncbi:hypothetical protein D9M71_561680 [compost metagenome]
MQQQALQCAPVLEFGLGLGREAPFLDRSALLDQGRVHRHGKSGDLLLGFFRHGCKDLGLYRLPALRRLRCGQGRLAGLGKARRQLGQVAAFAEELALAVQHFQVHLQMVVQLLRSFGPGFVTDPGTGHAQQFATERLGQRTFGKGHALQGRLDEIGNRYEVLADGLGQVAHQGNALGFQ